MFCSFLSTVNQIGVSFSVSSCMLSPVLKRSFTSLPRHRPSQLLIVCRTLHVSMTLQPIQVKKSSCLVMRSNLFCTRPTPKKTIIGLTLQSAHRRSDISRPTLMPKLDLTLVPFIRSAKTTSGGQGIHENISALQTKKRPLRRKLSVEKDVVKPGFWSVVAYTTAEEYDLEKLAIGLQEENLYEVCPWECGKESSQSGIPDVVYAKAVYQVGVEPREIFFFREGSLVLWNVPDMEVDSVLQFVHQYEQNSYDSQLLTEESESMTYTYAQPGKKSHLDNREGSLVVEVCPDAHLAKYTFSNAMAISVKLGVWEASLDRYVDSIEFVTEDLKQGTRISMSRDEVLRKTGQLFALRHLINLSSDLLDTPDFYWDRDELETLYLQTCNYFSIARRTKVMNEKLNHCVELVDLLSDHLNDRHHVRLEWMIIVLIMVEVGFEIIHYAHRWSE